MHEASLFVIDGSLGRVRNALSRRGEKNRHARGSGHPGLNQRAPRLIGWIPACAGMTEKENEAIFRRHCFVP
jgi:hypothetical protein